MAEKTGYDLYEEMKENSIEDPHTGVHYYYTSKHPLSMMYPREMAYQSDHPSVKEAIQVNSAAQAVAFEKAMHLGDVFLAADVARAEDGFQANRMMIEHQEALQEAGWHEIEEEKIRRVLNTKLLDPAFGQAAYLAQQEGVAFAEANSREQIWGAGIDKRLVDQAIEQGKEVQMTGANKLGEGFQSFGETMAQKKHPQTEVQQEEETPVQEFIKENLGQKQSLQEQLEGLNPGTEILVHPVSRAGTEYVTAIEEYPEAVQDSDFEYVLRSEADDLEIGDGFVGELDEETALVYVVSADEAKDLELALEGERIHDLLMEALEREYELAYEKVGVRLDAQEIDIEEAQERLIKKHGVEDPQSHAEAEMREAQVHFDRDPGAEEQIVHDAQVQAIAQEESPERQEELSIYNIEGRMVAEAKREAAARERAKEGIEGPSL